MVHGLLDAGRVAPGGEIVGKLPVADIFAFDQHAVEIEDDGIERDRSPGPIVAAVEVILAQGRSPNKAVPTRTWVAPIITAVS